MIHTFLSLHLLGYFVCQKIPILQTCLIMFSIYNNQFQPYLTRQNNYMQPDTYIMLYQACYKVLKRDEKS